MLATGLEHGTCRVHATFRRRNAISRRRYSARQTPIDQLSRDGKSTSHRHADVDPRAPLACHREPQNPNARRVCPAHSTEVEIQHAVSREEVAGPCGDSEDSPRPTWHAKFVSARASQLDQEPAPSCQDARARRECAPLSKDRRKVIFIASHDTTPTRNRRQRLTTP